MKFFISTFLVIGCSMFDVRCSQAQNTTNWQTGGQWATGGQWTTVPSAAAAGGFSGDWWTNTAATLFSNTVDHLTYGVVTGADTRVWLDRDLGAKSVATAANDYQAYGSLFQWGRRADGHQKITWTGPVTGTPLYGTTTNTSSTDNPGTNLFIIGTPDWRSPGNNDLWQGVNGTNNPSPPGFRLPTTQEWTTLATSAPAITNAATAYSSSLKLTLAGGRAYNTGDLNFTSVNGFWWASSVSGAFAYRMYDSGSAIFLGNAYPNRAWGFSVRCIKN